MKFFVGVGPSNAQHFDAAFVSVVPLRKRKTFKVRDWIMDSGAFTTIARHGGYPHPVSEYAAEVKRWRHTGNLLAAVAQDYMCEPAMLKKTGLTVADHQRLTIQRYDDLLAENTGVYIMPVLQGYTAEEYLSHIEQYGKRLTKGMWVGVGSVCKRNSQPFQVQRILQAIKTVRPDLRLHGFGLKITALDERLVRACLESADSFAWAYSARKKARPFAEDLSRRLKRKVTPKEVREHFARTGQRVPDPNHHRDAQLFIEELNPSRRARRSRGAPHSGFPQSTAQHGGVARVRL